MLGTGHWGNPGLDMAGLKFDDMLAPGRQAEIAALLDRLKGFNPTRVAVEVQYERTEEINGRYKGFREGIFTLTANEIYQLGFRLADALGHEQIYCIDSQGSGDWNGVYEYAREHGQAAKIDASLQQVRDDMAELSERITHTSLLELLRDDNNLARLEKDVRSYTDLAVIGHGDKYVGADLIGDWYARNLRMFVNITRIPTTDEDRIFLVVGAGHVMFLKHFLESSGRYELEDIGPYLVD